jgi:hypothetical protein
MGKPLFCATQEGRCYMSISLYDHLYDDAPEKQNATSWMDALKHAFINYNHVTDADYVEDAEDGVFFVHDQNVAKEDAATWVAQSVERFVVLVGSEETPSYRELDGQKNEEGAKWGFCPWSADEFKSQQKDEIKSFINSVKTGTPDFSLFVSVNADNLTALSILTEGHLIVHARHSQQVDLIPKRLVEAAGRLQTESSSLENAQSSSFWDVFDGANTDSLKAILGKEWKALGGGSHLDYNISDLVDAIATHQPISDVTMVANAYMAIAERLGAKRGK